MPPKASANPKWTQFLKEELDNTPENPKYPHAYNNAKKIYDIMREYHERLESVDDVVNIPGIGKGTRDYLHKREQEERAGAVSQATESSQPRARKSSLTKRKEAGSALEPSPRPVKRSASDNLVAARPTSSKPKPSLHRSETLPQSLSGGNGINIEELGDLPFESEGPQRWYYEPGFGTSSHSTYRAPAFQPDVLRAGTYEIVLVLDNRERKDGWGYDDAFVNDLRKHNVPVVRDALELGDALWCARLRGTDDKVALDFVVERKRDDDMANSITDGRFREQQFRMRRSGIQNVIYVFERHRGGREISEILKKSATTSANETVIVEKYSTEWTKNVQDTIDLYAKYHKIICNRYQGKDIHVIPDRVVQRDTYLDLQYHLRKTDPSTPYYTTYKSFKDLNNKSRYDNVQTMFGLSLLLNNRATSEVVSRILQRFSTSVDLENWLDEQTQLVRETLGSHADEETVMKRASLLLSDVMLNGRPLVPKAAGQNIYRNFMAT